MTFESALSQPVIPTLIAESQELLGKSDQQLAKELGFDHPNIITLIKAGSMKLPMSKVPQLARAIDYAESDLLRTVLIDYAPELMAVIDKVWRPLGLTTNERNLVQSFRDLAKGRDVVPVVMDGQSIIALIAA